MTQEPVPHVSASHRLVSVVQRTGGTWEATYRLTLANTGEIGLAKLQLRLIDALGVPVRPGQAGPSVSALATGETIVRSELRVLQNKNNSRSDSVRVSETRVAEAWLFPACHPRGITTGTSLPAVTSSI
jgi:hypothetical protein